MSASAAAVAAPMTVEAVRAELARAEAVELRERALTEMVEARAGADAEAARAADPVADAAESTRRWRETLAAMRRAELRRLVEAVHNEANSAERRLVEARDLYDFLATTEAECGRTARGAVGVDRSPEGVEAAIKQCEAALARADVRL